MGLSKEGVQKHLKQAPWWICENIRDLYVCKGHIINHIYILYGQWKIDSKCKLIQKIKFNKFLYV